MIVQETYSENLIRTYSDANMKIRQNETGAIYDEAIDVTPVRYTYTETDEPIEPTPESEENEDVDSN